MKLNKLPMLWPYRYDNRTTWKYIDVIICNEKDKVKAQIIKWIKNPDFKYGYLDEEINNANHTI